MPGKGHFPSFEERLVRTVKANTTRTVGGLGSMASPSQTRDRVAASRRGVAGLPPTARLSNTEDFLIEDDADDTFTLEFNPINESWNVTCGYSLVDGEDYTISGKTLTILDPALTFIGASGTFPKTLAIQYDYLAGVPARPAGTTPSTQTLGVMQGATSTAPTADMPTVAAGDLLILALGSNNPLAVATGLTGWTMLVEDSQASGGVASAIQLWTKTADGTETDLAFTLSSSSRWITAVLAVAGAASSSDTAIDNNVTSFTQPTGGGPGTRTYYFTQAGRGVTGPDITSMGAVVTNIDGRSEGFSMMQIGYVDDAHALQVATSTLGQSWAAACVAVGDA